MPTFVINVSQLFKFSKQKMSKPKSIPTLIYQQLKLMITENKYKRNMLYQLTQTLNRVPLSFMNSLIGEYNGIKDSLKWLILLHCMTYQDKRSRTDTIQQLIQLVQPNPTQTPSSFDTLLLNDLILPYKHYLLKRNHFQLHEANTQTQFYMLINLIQTALSFTHLLFILGRYLLKQNQFLISFNVIMAKDLSSLYRALKLRMNSALAGLNAETIQKMNDNLYVVYYNCYFNEHVSDYAPSWIDIDQLYNFRTNQKSIKQRLYSEEQNTFNTEEQSQHNLSICPEENSSTCLQIIKSVSTIATHREDTQQTYQQRSMRERKQFIVYASSLLTDFKDNSLPVTQITIY